MSIDYSLAQEYGDWVHAIFIIESNENVIAVGDGGQALGLGQMHPTMFAQYYHAGGRFGWDLHDTWSDAWVKVAARFFDCWSVKMGLDKSVMAYNLGVDAVLKGGRNPEYLQRFNDALNRVHGMANAKAV